MSPLGGAVSSAETSISRADVSCEAAWYVIQTQRHRERVAKAVLAEREVLSYLPMIEQWPRPVVGTAIAPMFPGYLFVQVRLTNDFTRIARTPGVKEFVRFGADPPTVDENVIGFLRSRESPDGVIREERGPKRKSRVLIVHGPFRGLTALVEERLPARERICVLMQLLQRETRVELPERWVRMA